MNAYFDPEGKKKVRIQFVVKLDTFLPLRDDKQ